MALIEVSASSSRLLVWAPWRRFQLQGRRYNARRAEAPALLQASRWRAPGLPAVWLGRRVRRGPGAAAPGALRGTGPGRLGTGAVVGTRSGRYPGRRTDLAG